MTHTYAAYKRPNSEQKTWYLISLISYKVTDTLHFGSIWPQSSSSVLFIHTVSQGMTGAVSFHLKECWEVTVYVQLCTVAWDPVISDPNVSTRKSSELHTVTRIRGLERHTLSGAQEIQNLLFSAFNTFNFQRCSSEVNFTYKCLIDPVLLGSKIFYIKCFFTPKQLQLSLLIQRTLKITNLRAIL